MLSAPGEAMLDVKLFVNRFHGPFPDLYERWWDGEEWIWVNHGRPGVTLVGGPGAAMMNSKLFVGTANGHLFERFWTGAAWVWVDHGLPPGTRVVTAPGAAMMNSKLFVGTANGHLFERFWTGAAWVWVDHGLPPGTRVVTAPGAAMMNSKLFVGTANGHLFERFWTGAAWVWVDHGLPPGTRVVTAPGAAMMNSKLFVGTANGHLFERFWTGAAWVWVDHGLPPGTRVVTAPGAAMMNSKLFVGTANGHLFERFWTGAAWVWVDHGLPPGTRVVTAPGAAMMNSKLFVSTANDHLFERFWTGAAWAWVDHGTARHDDARHVLGIPGSDPKLTIAIMGDGFAEADLNTYHGVVQNDVLGALGLDQLSGHQADFRIIRIDVVSTESLVTERQYDKKGTEDPSDDSILSEQLRSSRLGVIANGEWSHNWFDIPAFTRTRIEKLRRRFAPDADHIIVVVNSTKNGGLSSVGPGVAFFNRLEESDVIAHELGHNLFELNDEYVNDTRTFSGTSASANTSERPANWANLKWSALVTAGAPLPTDPAALPAGWDPRTSVGAFEGAGGRFSKGLFRPVLQCRMNQNTPPWCPVCARKIADDLGAFK
ncbi:M64 family metallopeptidase [Methylobacterium nodulans]|uniref:Peptidase M64 n=1 Tax=Methylobacterium nodulans (strain LMG 21967 / CNCM I-2342 / ORS 2060) TaxID=460265 RepID=B8IMP1_METNO|nr:M64 family metallopeptidase [Methylobacterium nodulans]ACL60234.1 hypothetical protein Mnod_5389 [Methylobacterium nodulans ORS 2060]